MSTLMWINQGLIVFDTCIRNLINRKRKYIKEGRTVLIVFQQIFGDSVLIQNSLFEYTKIFKRESGYHVKLIASPSVIDFMKANIYVDNEIELEVVDFKRFLKDYRYYREVVKKYKGKVNTLIVPGTSLSSEIFSVANNAPRKIGLIRSVDVNKPLTMAVFSKIAYTERVRPDKKDMMLQRHRLLIHYLGNQNYQAKLPRLLPKEKIILENRYCVMCPGSSKPEKCWPVERFSEIADYIISVYNINVHLCGGVDEIELGKKIFTQIKNSDRVISHIGKTSFSDWSAIVQHADLVIGNDSATMHMAAASRRKAICIAGVYDKYQFFPYKVDALEEGDILPVTIYKDMPCEWCRTKGYNAGAGNLKCRDRIKKNQCSLCIDAITVNDVKKEVKKLLGETDR